MNRRITAISLMVLLASAICPLPSTYGRPPGTPASHVIVIDPAHGGRDAGVRISEKLEEKDVTLLIASLMEKELQKSGNIRVRLTRDGDRKISSADRRKIAAAPGAALFVGLHVNAGFGRNSSGYELYFPGFGQSSPSSPSSATPKNESAEILRDMTKNLYLNNSVRLALGIQKNLERVFPRKGRGLREAPVLIIEDLQIPAVSVELCFATNPDDRGKIADGNIQRAVARALAQGMRDYLR